MQKSHKPDQDQKTKKGFLLRANKLRAGTEDPQGKGGNIQKTGWTHQGMNVVYRIPMLMVLPLLKIMPILRTDKEKDTSMSIVVVGIGHGIAMIITNRTLITEEGLGEEDNIKIYSMIRGDRMFIIGAGVISSMGEEHQQGTTINKAVGGAKLCSQDLIKDSSIVLVAQRGIEAEDKG